MWMKSKSQLSWRRGDDLSAVACVLEKRKFNVNPAFPEVLVGGERAEDTFQKLDFNTTYKFSK